MELKIGKRIQDLRKQKGLTQEQVAAALNISAAAVSKWETDTTYPDITILNPLARLLGVSVDVLLDFQEQMTEEECMKRMEKADTLFSTRNWEEGQQYCEELLKEFPTDLFLKFRVASTYMQYAGASLQEEILKQQMERSITLFEESTASENAEISETAWYVLSGLYCMNEEYEKGLEAVEKLPQPDFDARSMKSSILYQMGKLEESEKLTHVSSYGAGTSSSGVVKIGKDLDTTIEGKNVLVVEDIIDSGRTLSYLLQNLKTRNPKSLKLCTLLDKPDRRVCDVKVDYVGFEIPDEFVVGFGLDLDQQYRNLPYIGCVELEDEE